MRSAQPSSKATLSPEQRAALVRDLMASGVSRAHAYRLAKEGHRERRRDAAHATGAHALATMTGLGHAEIGERLRNLDEVDFGTISTVALLRQNRETILADEVSRARLIAEVDRAAADDLARGDEDARACDLVTLEADLRAGLARVEKNRTEANMSEVVERLSRARLAYDRLAERRALAGLPPPWPVPDGGSIYEVLAGLARCPRPRSNAWRIASIDAELSRLGALPVGPRG